MKKLHRVVLLLLFLVLVFLAVLLYMEERDGARLFLFSTGDTLIWFYIFLVFFSVCFHGFWGRARRVAPCATGEAGIGAVLRKAALPRKQTHIICALVFLLSLTFFAVRVHIEDRSASSFFFFLGNDAIGWFRLTLHAFGIYLLVLAGKIQRTSMRWGIRVLIVLATTVILLHSVFLFAFTKHMSTYNTGMGKNGEYLVAEKRSYPLRTRYRVAWFIKTGPLYAEAWEIEPGYLRNSVTWKGGMDFPPPGM